MSSFIESSDREPDFRIRYKKLDTPQRFIQHVRSDFKFEKDAESNIIWMIWPEFEESSGVPLPKGQEAEATGSATMWILNEEEEYRKELRKRIYVGAKGFLVAGSLRVAEAEILELLGNELAYSKAATVER